MKLITIPASPFGRKVRVVIAEKGLTEKVELVIDNPWKPDTQVPEFNPVGKVPVLITDDGMTLYDSTVISEYLDSTADGVALYPKPGKERWLALRRARLADQALDAFIAVRLERNRPEAERSAGWIGRQLGVVWRCLDAMEQEAKTIDNKLTIGKIAFAVALGHFDFRRMTDAPDWRQDRPMLAAWYEAFVSRPSLQSTAPHD